MIENENNLEQQLQGQIPEYVEEAPEAPEAPKPAEEQKPKKIHVDDIHLPSMGPRIDKDAEDKFNQEHHISRLGESIFKNAEIRDGWMDVDRQYLGERDVFYPEDWQFKIRPATVEAIRNWSTIDDENANSVDRVFNEILKSCFAIQTSTGPLPWYNINAWDRFFFILLIREYTFINGDSKIEYSEDCPNCDNPVTFTLTSGNLLFDMPDPDVMPMYNRSKRIWEIDPEEYGLPMQGVITLWLPTLEKDINIRQWLATRYQEKPDRNFDPVLIRFLPWFLPKISKDDTIAQRQIREFKRKFDSWDIDTFKFMDDVITNIIVTPDTKLIQKCPTCGEEVTSLIRFPDGPSSLFAMESKFKKFGKK